MVLSLSFERGLAELRVSDEHPDRATVFLRDLGGAEVAGAITDEYFPYVGKYLKAVVDRLLGLDSD